MVKKITIKEMEELKAAIKREYSVYRKKFRQIMNAHGESYGRAIDEKTRIIGDLD